MWVVVAHYQLKAIVLYYRIAYSLGVFTVKPLFGFPVGMRQLLLGMFFIVNSSSVLV